MFPIAQQSSGTPLPAVLIIAELNKYPMHASVIETVKIMGYHHIARNQQKYLNRLIYILLEHLVQHCHRHPYLEAILHRNSEAEKYVADAIELFLQEQVEGGIGQGSQDRAVNKNNEIEEKYVNLQREHELQREELQDLRSRLAREEKKVAKVVSKYNAMADLTYELRCKQTQQLNLMEEEYQAALSEVNQRLSSEREEAIRLGVKVEYLERENVQLRARLGNQRTVKSYVMEPAFSKQKKQFNRVQSMSILIDRTRPVVKEQEKKQYSLTRCQSIDLPPTTHSLPKESHSTQTSLNSATNEASSQTSSEIQSVSVQTTPFEVALSAAETQTSLEKDTIPMSDYQGSTELTITQLEQLQDRMESASNQIATLSGLNSFYYKNYTQMNSVHQQQTQQLQKLTRYYNGLYDKHQDYREQQQIEQQQKDAQIAELQRQIQQLLVEREDLISLVHSQHQEPVVPQFQTFEFLRTADPSEQTDASAATPRRKLEEDDTTHSPPAHSDPTQSHPSPPFCWKTEEFIKKETISKYLLQMLDQNCRGQSKTALLHQIGECLGWGGDDLRILQLHARRTRLKQELSNQPQPQTFKDRFYHFLTNESDEDQ